MIRLVSSLGEYEVRADRPDARERPFSASAGLVVKDPRFLDPAKATVEGDRHFGAPMMTLRVRVSDPADPTAVEAREELMEHARACQSIELPGGRVVGVHGLESADSVSRGTWWEVTLRYLTSEAHGAVVAPEPDELPYLLAGPNLYLAAGPNLALVWTRRED